MLNEHIECNMNPLVVGFFFNDKNLSQTSLSMREGLLEGYSFM